MMQRFIVLVTAVVISVPAFGNSDSTVQISKKDSSYMNLVADAFFNVLGATYYNSPSLNDHNNLYLYYNLSITNDLNIREKVILHTYFLNELGYRIFFDSIALISSDQYSFNNNLLLPFGNRKFSAALGLNVNSQFWRHYEYRTNDDGTTERYLYSSFLSPVYTSYTGGINYRFWEQSMLTVGIATAQKTRIKNQSLYDERQEEVLYGIARGKKTKYAFGFTASLQITQQKIFKNFYVENLTEVFIQADHYQAFKYTTVNVRNTFHYLLFSHLRLSLQTELHYDVDAIGTKPYIINQLMLGIYFNNKM
jgi:hypothetical protein